MASYYMNASKTAGKLGDARRISGGIVKGFVSTYELAATHAADDVILVALLPATAIIYDLQLACDALTGLSDVNVGFYEEDGTTVVDDNILDDAVDISSALARGAATVSPMLTDLDLAEDADMIYELLGKTNADRQGSYWLALTLIAELTGAGTITVRGLYIV